MPPLKAFRDTMLFPSGVFAPVDCCHGFQRCIAVDCFARRSGAQPLVLHFDGIFMI